MRSAFTGGREIHFRGQLYRQRTFSQIQTVCTPGITLYPLISLCGSSEPGEEPPRPQKKDRTRMPLARKIDCTLKRDRNSNDYQEIGNVAIAASPRETYARTIKVFSLQ